MDERKARHLLAEYETRRDRLARDLTSYTRSRQARVFLLRAFWTLAAAAGILLVFLLVERTPIQSEFLRWVTSGVFYAAAGLGAFLALRAFTAPPGPVEAAVEIEAAAPRFRSGLSSAAEFQAKADEPGTSSALRKLTVAQAAEELGPGDLGLALSRFSRRRALATLLGLALVLAVWTGIAPHEVRRGAIRLTLPFTDLPAFSSLELAVFPGNRLVARGENLQITAVPNQPPEKDPVLVLYRPGSAEGTPTEMYPDESASRARFVYTLTGLQESTDYQVVCERWRSERFMVTVVPRPEVKRFQVTVHHPAYLASQPQKLPEGTGDCTVLVGTRIDLEGEASQRLKTAGLALDPGATQTCELVHGDGFRHSLTLATDTRYSVLLQNEFGLLNERPVKYQVTTIIDASPTVTILRPAADLPFPKSKRLDLKVVAKDDFGVVGTVLYYSVGDRRHVIPLNMKPDLTPRKEFEVEFPWLLDTLPVAPGTEIAYFVRAEDARQPVANVATTPTYKVAMPSMYDVYRGDDQAQGDVVDELKGLLEQQKVRRDVLQKTYEQIKHEGKLDSRTEQQLQQAIKEGEQREKDAQDLLEKFQEMQQNLRENPFTSPDAVQKLQKISELVNEVLDDEGKRLMKQLQQSLQEMKIDPKEMEKFEEAFTMENYLKELDRTAELLTQLRDEMKMNSLGQALEDLKRRQEAIASETAALQQKKEQAGTPLDEAERQRLDALRRQMAEVASEAAALRRKQPGSLSAEEQQRLDEMTRALQELASTTAALREKQQSEKGLTPAERRQLDDLTQQMAEMASRTAALQQKQQEAGPPSPEDQNRLDELAKQQEQLASEAAALERKQGGLTPEDESRLKDLARQQEKIKEELAALEKQSKELAAKKPAPGQPEHPAAEDLKNLRDRLQKEDFRQTSDDIKKDLEQKNFEAARQNQQKMLTFLEALKKDGQKICQTCSGGGGQPPQLDLSRFIRKAIQASRDQEQLLQQLQGVPDQFMRGQRPGVEGIIDEVSVLQVLVKDQGRALEEALETLVRTSFSVNPEVLEPLKGVQGIFSETVKNLEDRAVGQARQQQRELIRRFNLLAMELMRAQDQPPQSQSASSDPKNFLQQFKNLTRRQLSLYQKTMQQQMSPGDQKTLEQMKKMALEQKMIREALEQMMREGRNQRQLLGRLDDVLKDMQDLETQLLDPNQRREAADKQKSVYDRMLKAQKALRNRDEESEERKAEKASDLKQAPVEGPLPDAGSDTRDLSRDFLGDMKEDYPKSYETQLNDYFKSLSLYGGDR
ncbi:MAG: hypothetical protein GX442_12200 [Candidatus Riflebacteria bacterium]|nr:hypothetical protein [Candidatus Riflebacteria bacterium]